MKYNMYVAEGQFADPITGDSSWELISQLYPTEAEAHEEGITYIGARNFIDYQIKTVTVEVS